jgi:hypothetical protein
MEQGIQYLPMVSSESAPQPLVRRSVSSTGTASLTTFTIDQNDIDQTALDLDINNVAATYSSMDWEHPPQQQAP